MQYSSLGLTSVLYNFVIIFLDLHLIVLLISPSVEFAFLIAVLHCSVNFILLSTMMPKSRSFIESLKSLPHKLYLCFRLSFPKCITDHLSELNDICQSFAHLPNFITTSL